MTPTAEGRKALIKTGGDYPRDEATRELVVYALTAANMLGHSGDLPVGSNIAQGLMRAAKAWHKTHGRPERPSTDREGSGASGR